jgi:hypothetical protein
VTAGSSTRVTLRRTCADRDHPAACAQRSIGGKLILNPAPSANSATGVRPEVIVEFLFERGLLFIAVRNIGARPALGTSVRFGEKLLGLGGSKDIGSLALFRKLEFLGPGRELVTLFDSSSAYFARQHPTKLVVEIAYRDAEGTCFSETIRHDLEIFRELAYVDPPPASTNDCKSSPTE